MTDTEGKMSPSPPCLHKNQLLNVKSATVEQKSRSNITIHMSTHMFNRVSVCILHQNKVCLEALVLV